MQSPKFIKQIKITSRKKKSHLTKKTKTKTKKKTQKKAKEKKRKKRRRRATLDKAWPQENKQATPKKNENKKKRRKNPTSKPKKRKEKRKQCIGLSSCAKCKWAFLSYIYQTSPTQFSPHFGENFLVGLERKHIDSTIIFLSPSPNQILSKKFSPLIFSPFFFCSILPKIHSTKHTLKVTLCT